MLEVNLILQRINGLKQNQLSSIVQLLHELIQLLSWQLTESVAEVRLDLLRLCEKQKDTTNEVGELRSLPLTITKMMH